MAKDKERSIAKSLFIYQNLTRKEIAHRLQVQETTVGKWVAKYKWDEERTARQSMPSKQIENIKEILNDLAEQRIALNKKIDHKEKTPPRGEKALEKHLEELSDMRTRLNSIDDGASKWNKTLQNLQDGTKVNLGTYIEVMEEITRHLTDFDAKLAAKCAPFFEQHITQIANKIG